MGDAFLIQNIKQEIFINLEADLTLTRTQTANSEFTPYSLSDRENNVVFATTLTFPTNPSNGLIYELGGSGLGTWVGITDNGTNLRARAGDGSVSGTSSSTYMAAVNTSNFPKDGKQHVLIWEYRVNPGRVRVFIDGKLIETGNTTSGLQLGSSSVWAGTDHGSFLLATTGENDNIATGELTSPGYSPRSGNETLRMYVNQLVAV
jgi:hypothetical protein